MRSVGSIPSGAARTRDTEAGLDAASSFDEKRFAGRLAVQERVLGGQADGRGLSDIVKRKRIRSIGRGERRLSREACRVSHISAPFGSSRELKLDR